MRARLERVTPLEAYKELKEPGVAGVDPPTFLVDVRTQEAREREGAIEGAVVVERGILEWCFDPRSERRLPIVDRYDLRVILFSDDGDVSRWVCRSARLELHLMILPMGSLAAYSLHQLGLLNATDIVGGFRGWNEAGLPTEVPGHYPSKEVCQGASR